ncbi:hypothetical protein [Naasia lichenicola]|uniref:Uncharacterized protein n=1 Tax=Naasia lichenicola TaxID=2565933 RepID=A0A4S4FSC0_9MICO|nr:hypothetical protein [Naasia lichenicola]THG33294.1 hypothetical protein E6C64_02780 [Naasia lichenicola]
MAIFMWITVGYCNVLLLCTAAPFLVTVAIEGLFIARRSSDIRPFAFASVGAIAAVVVGLGIWHFAVTMPGVPTNFEAGMLTAASYILPIAIALSVLVYAAPRVRDRLFAAGGAAEVAAVRRPAMPSTKRDDAGTRVLTGAS